MRIPIVPLGSRLAKPRVERVIDHETVPQLLVVVLKYARQAERNGEEPGTLRRRVESIRVCAPNDSRQFGEGRLV